ncbi:MAG: hypothetical protein P8M22_05610 [Phycisphaerales bacterium]|nr:hypothetical protein [Phycisphaerales bacterium]
MRLAIATCSSLPDWEVDDAPLHDALVTLGIDFSHEIWTDETVDWAAYDACLIRTTWDYVQQLERFLEWASTVSSLTRLFNPMQTIQWNTRKSYLQDLESQQIPIVPTCWLEQGTPVGLDSILTNEGWPRGFIKPLVGATAFGTMRFDHETESLRAAQEHLDKMLLHQSMLVQPYLEQVETKGEWSGIFIDGKWSHAVQKIPTPGDYRVQDDFGATDHPGTDTGPARDLAENVMDVIKAHPGWTGEHDGISPLYARVDLLQNGDTHLVNEVELVEPSLFFRHAPAAAIALSQALTRRL